MGNARPFRPQGPPGHPLLAAYASHSHPGSGLRVCTVSLASPSASPTPAASRNVQVSLERSPGAFPSSIPPNFPPASSPRGFQRSRVTLVSKPSSGFHGHRERSPCRPSEALPSTPLPALLLGMSEGTLFQGPAQCHFLQEALQTSQSAPVSASSRYHPRPRDTGSGHTPQSPGLSSGGSGEL